MPQTVSAAARISTTKRLRMEYSMMRSITKRAPGRGPRIHSSSSSSSYSMLGDAFPRTRTTTTTRTRTNIENRLLFLVQLGDHVPAPGLHFQPAMNLISGFDPLHDLGAFDGELHLHRLHQPGDVVV